MYRILYLRASDNLCLFIGVNMASDKERGDEYASEYCEQAIKKHGSYLITFHSFIVSIVL